ncbi:SpoIIE family protein phosphatase [Streptomyces sp. NPDC006172]|uniref:SpoIIE family protein phosphatase n=1 Tax=Streptomyces sp. NPDC006172 TaxID=3154470 RepID=UPI0033C1FEA7
MGVIPTQRETVSRPGGASARPGGLPARTRATLAGGSHAPGAARDLVHGALTEWSGLGLPGGEDLAGRLAEDAVLVVSELVTNAVVHAGTDIDLVCRLCLAEDDEPEAYAVVVEVSDHHPSRAPHDSAPEPPRDAPEYGRGLQLVATLAEAWGVTYRRGTKTVWARLGPVTGRAGEAYGDDPPMSACTTRPDAEPTTEAARAQAAPATEAARTTSTPAGTARTGAVRTDPADPAHCTGADAPVRLPASAPHARDWLGRGALSFLAEASDLLAGQLDEDLVAELTGQLLVPRLADWCAVWLEDELSARGWGDGTGGPGPRLARVCLGGEHRVEELRRTLEKDPPHPSHPSHPPYPPHPSHPPDAAGSGPTAFPWPAEALGPGGSALAYRLIAGGRPLGTLVIGRAGLLRFPDEVTGLVEDLGRRVALAIGAARQYARQVTISAVLQRGLLPGAVAEIPGLRSALVYEPREQGGPSGDFYDLFPAGDGRWCFAVGDVQGKGPEAAVVIGLARPWLRLLAREGYGVPDVLDRLNQLLLDDATEAADAAARAFVGPAGPADGPQTRFLSLLYGELVPFDGGVRCTLASAGHPLPLLLGPDGSVTTAAQPQTLLGVVEDATYTSETLELRPGDTLLCVTDGVTERRSGPRQFDDGDGLALALADCAGLDADLIAERVRDLVHAFGDDPPEDDLALLVLQAE